MLSWCTLGVVLEAPQGQNCLSVKQPYSCQSLQELFFTVYTDDPGALLWVKRRRPHTHSSFGFMAVSRRNTTAPEMKGGHRSGSPAELQRGSWEGLSRQLLFLPERSAALRSPEATSGCTISPQCVITESKHEKQESCHQVERAAPHSRAILTAGDELHVLVAFSDVGSQRHASKPAGLAWLEPV